MRVIGLVGWSGSGKTTLLKRLVPALDARGVSVSTVKHAHHGFDLDTPGKDSFEHRAAGATEVIVSSARRFALMHELRGEAEWRLAALLEKLSPVDFVIVEGFKREAHAKIEVWRAATGKPPLYEADADIVAVASDTALPQAGLSVVSLDDIPAITDLAMAHALPLAATLARLRAAAS